MNIIIYNGDLKPTTFVLRLAKVVNEVHKAFVFGTSPKLFKYADNDIIFVPTDSRNKLVLLIQVAFQLISFFCMHPKKCIRFISILFASHKPLRTKLKQFLTWTKLITNRVDVLHIQWSSHIYLFEELLDYSYFKTIVSLRGSLINIAPVTDSNLKALYNRTFPKVDQFHAVSQHMKMQAVLYGASENKIKIIYSGVEMNSFENFRKIDYSKGEQLKILSVGRQHWNKGYNYALDAIKVLLENNINVSFTIIGAADSEELIYTIDDLDVNANVTITSKMKYEDVLKAMQKADVLLLPSVSEGIANVVIEAMCIGLPVISTNVMGMPELVIDNETGLIFKNRDVNNLVEKIMYFNTMPHNDIETMSAKALKKVTEQHNWKLFRQNFNDLFQKTYNLEHSKNESYSNLEASVNYTKPSKNQNSETECKKLQIVTIANINWIEGLDYALDAMKLLKEKNLDFQYHIIGSGTTKEFERYKFQRHQNQLQNHVIFHSELSEKAQLLKLSTADIYLKPSLQMSYCQPVLKAQKRGLIVILTDVGEFAENMIEQNSGFKVLKRSPLLLAKKIIEVHNLTEEEKETISKNAINVELNNFNEKD